MLDKPDTYHTIIAPSTGEFKDRGSKFIAYAFPCYHETAFQNQLLEVKKEHPKARHHCYAYRLGTDKNIYRTNDDGEPSGTAGRPILGQIDRFGLSNIFVVVVRYFGGTKLGTTGLINAYKTSTQEALNKAEITQKTLDDIFQITFDYAIMSNIMNAIKKRGIEIIKQDFGNLAQVDIAIRKSQVQEILVYLKAKAADLRIEEISSETNIKGFEINYLYTR